MRTERQVSKYAAIWAKLKSTGKCRLVSDPSIHRRIIKAVIKRKDEDLVYKMLLAEENKKGRLAYTIDNNELIFVLTLKPIEITINDL